MKFTVVLRPYPALLVALLVIGMLMTSRGTRAQSITDTVTARFDVQPQVVVTGETTATLSLSLTGSAANCPASLGTTPQDVAILLDTRSIDSAGLSALQSAFGSFLAQMKLTAPNANARDQLAVVSIEAQGPTLVQPLTSSADQLQAAINAASAVTDNAASLSAGLRLATDAVIDPERQNLAADRFIVIVSGRITDPELDSAVLNARSAGARLIVIDPTGISPLLAGIVSAPSDYLGGDVANGLNVAAQRIQARIAAAQIDIRLLYEPFNLDFQVTDLTPPGALDINSSTIQWARARLRDGETVTYNLRARVRSSVAFEALSIASATYRACDRDGTENSINIAPLVLQAQAPTPTPSPTFTPIPLTPTPLPTDAPRMSFMTPNAPTAIPANQPAAIPFAGLGLCADGSANIALGIIALILLLIGLLAVALWLWPSYQRSKDTKAYPGWCFILKTLLLFYTLFTIFLFAIPLVASACTTGELVYFWRQDSTTNLTGIYQSMPSGGDAIPVASLNQGCVGCHTTGANAGIIAAVQGPPPGALIAINADGTRIPAPVGIEAMYISFAPDGRRAVIATSREDLVLWDLQTNTTTPLPGASEQGVLETMPTWGPNGRIAFVRVSHNNYMFHGLSIGTSSDIYTVAETGGTAVPLQGASGLGFNYYPAYSPDGRWLAFTHHTNQTTYGDSAAEIYLVPAAGGQRIRLAANVDINGQPTQSNSWPSWNTDGTKLAFNSRRIDPNFDIYVTDIASDGSSGPAVPLPGASVRGVFEHTPFWGYPTQRVSLGQAFADLLPWLLPIPLLAMLAWLICRIERVRSVTTDKPASTKIRPAKPQPPIKPLPPAVEHQVRPTLIIGLGEVGRWVLTHVKHSLTESHLGELPSHVKLLAIDTGRPTKKDEPIRFAGTTLSPEELLEITDNLTELMRSLRGSTHQNTAYREWVNPSQLLDLGDAALDMKTGLNNRRIPARIGLINHLQQNPQGGLLQRLETLMPQALKDNRLNVVIVGDTYSDIGSAILFDLAIILRRLAEKDPLKGSISGVSIDAHVITSHQNNTDVMPALNTAFFLREAKRFQLAGSRPVNIHLGRPELDGTFDRLPIDRLALYHELAFQQIERSEQAQQRPYQDRRYGIYPMLADTLIMTLDHTYQSDSKIVAQKTTEQSTAAQEQKITNDLMLASNGLMQYRLPMYHLLQQLSVRYMGEMVNHLLDQTIAEGFNNTQDASELAEQFLTGQINLAEGRLGEMHTLAYMLFKNAPIRDLDVQLGNIGGASLDEDAQKHLANFTATLLNGQEGSEPRRGKLNFTLGFLSNLRQWLDKFADDISKNPLADGGGKTVVINAIKALKALTAKLTSQLKQQQELLGGGDELQKTSLRYQLRQRMSELEQARTEMNKLANRAYIWTDGSQDLAEKWFQDAFTAYFGEAMSLLYWQVDPAGSIHLTVNAQGSESVKLTMDKRKEFAEVLEKVVAHYCLSMGSPDSEKKAIYLSTVLQSLLSADLLSINKLNETIDTLDKSAQSLLPYGSANSENFSVYVAANVNIDTSAIQTAIGSKLVKPEGMIAYNASDPFSLTVKRRVAVVPLEQVKLDDVRAAYNSQYHPKSHNQIDVAVYEAEHVALDLEQRMVNELETQVHELHPIVVSGLSESGRARAFCLALAAGEISFQERRGERTIMLLAQEVNGNYPLTIIPSVADKTVAPLIQAFLSFTLSSQTLPDEVYQKMIARYKTDDDILSLWQEFVDGGWKEYSTTTDTVYVSAVEDLLLVARLWALEYLSS